MSFSNCTWHVFSLLILRMTYEPCVTSMELIVRSAARRNCFPGGKKAKLGDWERHKKTRQTNYARQVYDLWEFSHGRVCFLYERKGEQIDSPLATK